MGVHSTVLPIPHETMGTRDSGVYVWYERGSLIHPSGMGQTPWIAVCVVQMGRSYPPVSSPWIAVCVCGQSCPSHMRQWNRTDTRDSNLCVGQWDRMDTHVIMMTDLDIPRSDPSY